MDGSTGGNIGRSVGILERLKKTAPGWAKGPRSMALYLRQLVRGNDAPHAAPDRSWRGANKIACEPPEGAAPVLLLQGFLANRGSMHLLAQRLTERGHIVMTYKLGLMNLGDIRHTARIVARRVESLIEQTGVQRVDIVGHSMGGLVALYYLKRLGGRHRVRRMVLMGTPNEGTWTALFALATAPFGAASRQLLPQSRFLKELRENSIPSNVDLVTMGGDQDFFAPVRSTILEGARHVVVATSHSGFLVQADVADELDRLLREPMATPKTDFPK